MVLFTTAVEHIIRAVRILSTEGSHLLLIGVGGSGRKCVARLAVYLCFSCQTVIFESDWQ
jgi:dynein heavy chain